MANDPEKEYNDFLVSRQAKIDAERAKNKADDERAEYGSGFNNPPAVRGTDGLPPGTPEQNPIEMAAKVDAGVDTDNDDDAAPVTADSTKAKIMAYLDEQGITYDPAAKKADLVKLLPAE